MRKIDVVKNRLKKIESRNEELKALMKPHQEKLAPFLKESSDLWDESRKLKEQLDDLSFEPSLAYILSTTHDKFHYRSSDHKCSYSRMNKFIYDNYKYLKISGYNPKTNIYAIELVILTGADASEVAKELSPAIKLALKAGQEGFKIFTDDLSASGIVTLQVKDGKYEIGKTSWGSSRPYKTCDTLIEAVKFCLENKLTYSRD